MDKAGRDAGFAVIIGRGLPVPVRFSHIMKLVWPENNRQVDQLHLNPA